MHDRPLLLLAVFLALATNQVLAADAAFSKDGHFVYLLDYRTPQAVARVIVVDVDKQAVSELDFGKQTNRQQIRGLGVSNAGHLLFTTEQAAWAYHFEKKSCAKLAVPPKDARFLDLAYNRKNSSLLFSTRIGSGPPFEGGALILERDGNAPVPMWMRRVGFLTCMAFTPDGDLFFGTRGDLWHGTVQKGDPGDPRPFWLEGVRSAPLATLETSEGTPTETGVFQIAVAGTKLYVHLHRIGGSGTGNVIRLTRPPETTVDAEDELPHRLAMYTQAISSVEILAENGTYSYLCASPDGRRVFFRGAAKPENEDKPYQFYLVEDNGQPRLLNIELPARPLAAAHE
ncbi:MAG: hypothetical protein P4L99_03925 [Chthoniobacter sp.]|nr:hypothetical protein [Chthoniobacter sp.]